MPQAIADVGDSPATSATGRKRGSGAASAGAKRNPGSNFAPLLRIVKEQGLLERRTAWYARTMAVNLGGLAAVITAVALVGGSWWVLLLAPALALLSTRTAFFAHDAGHAQITGDRRKSRLLQLFLGNLLLGMSQQWWNDKHNRHHAHPNHIEKDPDVRADILVFTQKQAVGRTGFRGWLTRHQAWLFFPLTTLEGIALKVYGFRAVFAKSPGSRPPAPGRNSPGSQSPDVKPSGSSSSSNSSDSPEATPTATRPVGPPGDGPSPSPRARAIEGLSLAAHVIGYVTLLLTTMPLGQALLFALIHQMLLGLHLGMAFAPNHKGMEMPPDEESGERWGHLRRQVLTSRNVRGGPVTDWFLGGLNYQIEHHLFPNMPRPNLRLAQPLVRAHCHALSLSYAETGLVESYRQALAHMREVGEPLRADA